MDPVTLGVLGASMGAKAIVAATPVISGAAAATGAAGTVAAKAAAATAAKAAAAKAAAAGKTAGTAAAGTAGLSASQAMLAGTAISAGSTAVMGAMQEAPPGQKPQLPAIPEKPEGQPLALDPEYGDYLARIREKSMRGGLPSFSQLRKY